MDTSVEPASDNRLIQRLYGRNEYLYPSPHNKANAITLNDCKSKEHFTATKQDVRWLCGWHGVRLKSLKSKS